MVNHLNQNAAFSFEAEPGVLNCLIVIAFNTVTE